MIADVVGTPPSGPILPAEFRAFQACRPDHERWELVNGEPRMILTTIVHNFITGRLESLLFKALMEHDPTKVSCQHPGVELGVGENDCPEPDVAVIDADYAPGQRFTSRCYFLAEIVSDSDDQTVPGTSERWIEVKRRLYRGHTSCAAVVVIQENRIDVLVDVKTATGWHSERLTTPDQLIILPRLGLRCSVADLYRNTPLMPRLRTG
ncbi:Uma2 family endonuclease [Microvirga sp. Mcv34]|uniref:Uma2 family endonuclease n=1 Tax=Microvirga sp. Mcv34 TaxID=2926016 RepID=UPI0021C90F9C|nr:Uma2 family endonuclease [Microvirga sp. Mcv34]